MKLVANESVDRQIVDRLRAAGHRVDYVAEISPALPDDGVLALANLNNAILLTADKDFGEMIFRRGLLSHGIILIRLAGLSPESKAERAGEAIALHGERARGSMAVVTPSAIRIRPFSS